MAYKKDYYWKYLRGFDLYWDYREVARVSEFISGQQGLRGQALKLLEIDPCHRYAHNIANTITQHDNTIAENEIKIKKSKNYKFWIIIYRIILWININ